MPPFLKRGSESALTLFPTASLDVGLRVRDEGLVVGEWDEDG